MPPGPIIFHVGPYLERQTVAESIPANLTPVSYSSSRPADRGGLGCRHEFPVFAGLMGVMDGTGMPRVRDLQDGLRFHQQRLPSNRSRQPSRCVCRQPAPSRVEAIRSLPRHPSPAPKFPEMSGSFCAVQGAAASMTANDATFLTFRDPPLQT